MKVIITGGAGFIGCNAASRALNAGHEVVVIDNLARPGVSANLEWLRSHSRGTLRFHKIDIRDPEAVAGVFRQHADADRVLHMASQVAVTTSVLDPRTDFEVNALGTLNLLEAMRNSAAHACLIYASTNKVYGSLADLAVTVRDGRYAYSDLPHGIPEERGLDFHSPYGCSKGAAEQYVLDYGRIYGLRTVVFRQSCIYGHRQFGAVDQGWVAWFMIAAMLGHPITVYGDGRQTRDVLFIDDLLDAFDCAFQAGPSACGRVFNIGGGSQNTLSILEVIDYIGERRGSPLPYEIAGWRHSDQKVFVCDIRRAQRELNWQPRISTRQGLGLLYDWIQRNRSAFEELGAPSLAAARHA